MASTEEVGWDGALAFKGEWGLGRQSQGAVARTEYFSSGEKLGAEVLGTGRNLMFQEEDVGQ